MRRLLALTLCGGLYAPAMAWAQDPPPTPQPEILPLPAPAAAPDSSAPALGDPADKTVTPVTVEPKDKKPVITKSRVGGAVGSVVGGLAGAAVLGPVGKFVGGFAGKTVAKALVGGGKKDEAKPGDAGAEQAAQTITPPSAETSAVEAASTAPVLANEAPPTMEEPAPAGGPG